MESLWSAALWRQFGLTLDMLETALLDCPDSLWTGRLWPVRAGHSAPAEFAEFWYVTYHTLFWLDLYLSGCREEDFVPPAPFRWTESDPVWVLPDQPYTQAELRTYLTALRQKGQTTLGALTDEQARRVVEYPWTEGRAVSFLELQLYNMRHVQEHAAQLSLFLGQHAIPDEASAPDAPAS